MAHVFDTSLYATGSSDPTTMQYTCDIGSTLLVLGIAVSGTARTIAAPTFGGKAFTAINRNTYDPGEMIVEMWELTNPSTGVQYTISVPNAGTARTLYLRASSYKAGHGFTSTYDSSSAGGATSGVNASTNIAVTAGGVATQILGHGGASLPTAYSNFPILPVDHGALISTMQYALPTSTATIRMWFAIATDDWTIVTGSWKELAAAPLPPRLIYPANNGYDSNDEVIFTWATSAGADASSYSIQVCTSTSFITNDISVAGITTTSYNAGETLPTGSDYYWRVRGTNNTGTSNWSSTYTFYNTFTHAFDTSIYVDNGSTNPATFNYTCGEGTTLFALAIYTVGSAVRDAAATPPTYGGINTTSIDGLAQYNGSSEIWTEMWYLLNPPSGSQIVSVNNPNSRDLFFRAVSYKAREGYETVFDSSAGANSTGSVNPSTNIVRTYTAGEGAGLLIASLATGLTTPPTDYYPTIAQRTVEFFPVDHGNYSSVLFTNRRYIVDSGTYSFGAPLATDDWSLVGALFKQKFKEYSAVARYYNGASWVECSSSSIKYYDGADWKICPPWALKVYIDNEWKPVRFQG